MVKILPNPRERAFGILGHVHRVSGPGEFLAQQEAQLRFIVDDK
jgi:hypothetical protein